MESSTSMLDRLKESKIFKVVSGYALVAFITVQIASLVSDSFGFGQEFMQNIIIVFLYTAFYSSHSMGSFIKI